MLLSIPVDIKNVQVGLNGLCFFVCADKYAVAEFLFWGNSVGFIHMLNAVFPSVCTCPWSTSLIKFWSNFVEDSLRNALGLYHHFKALRTEISEKSVLISNYLPVIWVLVNSINTYEYLYQHSNTFN